MSPSLSRLILSVVFLASVGLVLFLTAMLSFEVLNLRDPEAATLMLLTSATYLIMGWLGIWRGAVKWTPWRGTAVVVSVGVSLLVAALPGALVQVIMDSTAAMFVTACAWALLWLASTAVIWRETKTERIERLKMLGINAVICPNCGYNLTGMTTTTCPECGSQYTLDQLYAQLAQVDTQVDQL